MVTQHLSITAKNTVLQLVLYTWSVPRYTTNHSLKRTAGLFLITFHWFGNAACFTRPWSNSTSFFKSSLKSDFVFLFIVPFTFSTRKYFSDFIKENCTGLLRGSFFLFDISTWTLQTTIYKPLFTSVQILRYSPPSFRLMNTMVSRTVLALLQEYPSHGGLPEVKMYLFIKKFIYNWYMSKCLDVPLKNRNSEICFCLLLVCSRTVKFKIAFWVAHFRTETFILSLV